MNFYFCVMAVLRLGSWARLHHEVREVTFEDQVTRIRDRVKHENPERKKILAYLEKLNELKTDKEFITSQMDSLEENVRIVKKTLENFSSTIYYKYNLYFHLQGIAR